MRVLTTNRGTVGRQRSLDSLCQRGQEALLCIRQLPVLFLHCEASSSSQPPAMRNYTSSILLATTACAVVTASTQANSTRGLSPMLDSVAAQLCGLDIVGGDLTNYKSKNPDGCLIPCGIRTQYESNAATWTDYEGGTCWCKKVPEYGWDFLTQKTGAISLVDGRPLTNGVEIVVFSWPNFDLVGNDIGNVPAKTFSDCDYECMKSNRCFAHTWTNYNGGTCWMKSKVGERVKVQGAISGYVARQFVKQACST